MSDPAFEIVIGLEVHVQLRTRTKLFCRCSTEFGAPPNTQTCPVCTGMPGSLPKLNRRAIELAVQAALALNCQIPNFTKWDRKNYFYPDLPKGYQITQFDLPVSQHGFLDIEDRDGKFETKRIGIIRAHLEEDAGKSMHDEASGTADSSIDLNRTGTPLLEIVSAPDMSDPNEAKTYLEELKLILQYLDVSDCNMQEGSLRVDANVNLHIDTPDGIVATPIVEVKNMNSFRAVERALAYESNRQFQQWKQDGKTIGEVPKQTRGWDDQAEITLTQREKEESSDYRYFPDPDLVPVIWSSDELESWRRALRPRPAEIRRNLQEQFELSAYDAYVLVQQGPALIDYLYHLIDEGVTAKRAANWLQQDILKLLKDRQESISEFPVSASSLAALLQRVESDSLSTTRAREVLQAMVESNHDVETAMQAIGIRELNEDELESICRQLLEEHPQTVIDVQAGKTKAVGALIGKARNRDPNADPIAVKEICLRLISEMK